jgi:hypothetical protein
MAPGVVTGVQCFRRYLNFIVLMNARKAQNNG